jgi:hypothetical protein
LESSSTEIGQVIALLRAAGIEEPKEVRVAAGDRFLLQLHHGLTGRHLEVAAECRECGTVSAAVLSPEALQEEAPRTALLGWGGGLRSPTYGDLLELPFEADQAEEELLRRCTVGRPSRAGGAQELEAIDDSLTGPIVLACVECGGLLEIAVDVERLVLEHLQRFAAEVELEIHLLAREYGWRLGEIEALTDGRRRRLARFVTDGR